VVYEIYLVINITMTLTGSVLVEPFSNRALSKIFLTLFEQQSFNEARVADPAAPEALHDYRIAVRKTRALLDRMDQIIAEPSLSRFRQGFAALMKKTGPLRDLQVCTAMLLSANPGPILSNDSASSLMLLALQQQHRNTCSRLSRYLTAARHQRFKQDWLNLVEQIAVREPVPDQTDDGLMNLASKAVRHAYQKTVRQADKAGRRGSTSSLHKLRKYCKDLRYLLDIFAEQFAEPPRSAVCRQLKRVQRRLGRMQDQHILYQTLRETAGQLEEKLDKQQHKAVIKLIKQIKVDKLKLKEDAARLARRYPKDSAPYMRQLLEL
jgi:CHAD domain-containing protein